MIKYDVLNKELEKAAGRINVNRRKDWLDNAIHIISKDIDSREDFPTEEAREDSIYKSVYQQIKKLDVISGGDIGPVYLHHMGEFSQRSAGDVVKGKLCSVYPEGISGNMERGMVTRQINEKKYLDSPQRSGFSEYHKATQAVDAMFKETGKWDDHPWVEKYISSKVYLDKLGELWLVKFTCPGSHETVMAMQDKVPADYQAQLALDKLKIEEAFRLQGDKIFIEHTVVVPFSMKDWEPFPVEFEVDPIMECNVLDAGDDCWDNVLNEKIPTFKSDIEFNAPLELSDELAKNTTEFLILKKAESRIKSMTDSLKVRIEDSAARFGINVVDEGHKTRVASVDITTGSTSSVDNEKLLSLFIEMKIKENPDYKLAKDEIVWDESIKPKLVDMKRFLKEKGRDPKDFMIPGTKKSDPERITAAYMSNGGEARDIDYYKITRKINMELVKASYLLMGGDMKDERILNKSTQLRIAVLRNKSSGNEALIDDADAIAEELLGEMLATSPDLIAEHIKIAKADKSRDKEVEDFVEKENINVLSIDKNIEQSKRQAPTLSDELSGF
jgi:hypothetical protein